MGGGLVIGNMVKMLSLMTIYFVISFNSSVEIKPCHNEFWIYESNGAKDRNLLPL